MNLSLGLLVAALLRVGPLYSVDVHNTPPSNSSVIKHSSNTTKPSSKINMGFMNHTGYRYKYNSPEDLLDLIPVIRDINRLIPRQFSLADHKINLAAKSMVVSHEFLDQKARKKPKHSIISMTYSSLGQQFGTHLDVPLFYSSVHGFSDWSAYPMGNYTMTINRHSQFRDEIKLFLKARTRF